MTPGQWRKSSRSGGNSPNCVEIRYAGPVEVRDSKAPSIGSLAITRTEFAALLDSVKLSRHKYSGPDRRGPGRLLRLSEADTTNRSCWP
jgi:hypothetical protein